MSVQKKEVVTDNLFFLLVPEAGLEPARPQWPKDFKSFVSTNSTTRASLELKNPVVGFLSGRRDSNPRP